MLTGVNWLLFLIIIFGSKIDLCLTPNNSWHNEREWQTTARNFFDWLTFSRFKNLVPQNHQLQLGATDDLAYITGSHTASVLPLSGLRELPSVLEFSGKHQPISPMLFCLAERASGYQCGCVWYCITMDTLHGSKENKYRRPWRFKLCAWRTVGKRKKKGVTWTTELMFLDLSHVDPAELWWRWALCEQTKCGPLTQPLGQPGQVAVTIQIIWVQTAKGGKSNYNEEASILHIYKSFHQSSIK